VTSFSPDCLGRLRAHERKVRVFHGKGLSVRDDARRTCCVLFHPHPHPHPHKHKHKVSIRVTGHFSPLKVRVWSPFRFLGTLSHNGHLLLSVTLLVFHVHCCTTGAGCECGTAARTVQQCAWACLTKPGHHQCLWRHINGAASSDALQRPSHAAYISPAHILYVRSTCKHMTTASLFTP
jgi:hypothetical protein